MGVQEQEWIIPFPKFGNRKGMEKKQFPKFENGKGMKKTFPNSEMGRE